MPVRLRSYANGFTSGAPSMNIDTTDASMVVVLCKMGFSSGITLDSRAMTQVGGSSAMWYQNYPNIGASKSLVASGISLTDYSYIVVLKEANAIIASDRQDVTLDADNYLDRSINTGIGRMALMALNLYNDNYMATETPGDFINDHTADGTDGRWRYRFKRVQSSDAASEAYRVRLSSSSSRILTSIVSVGYQPAGYAVVI